MRERTLGLIVLARRAALATAAAEVGPREDCGDTGLCALAHRPLAATRAVRRDAALDRLRAARVALRNVERIAGR